jgi:hypothetical protein
LGFLGFFSFLVFFLGLFFLLYFGLSLLESATRVGDLFGGGEKGEGFVFVCYVWVCLGLLPIYSSIHPRPWFCFPWFYVWVLDEEFYLVGGFDPGLCAHCFWQLQCKCGSGWQHSQSRTLGHSW